MCSSWACSIFSLRGTHTFFNLVAIHILVNHFGWWLVVAAVLAAWGFLGDARLLHLDIGCRDLYMLWLAPHQTLIQLVWQGQVCMPAVVCELIKLLLRQKWAVDFLLWADVCRPCLDICHIQRYVARIFRSPKLSTWLLQRLAEDRLIHYVLRELIVLSFKFRSIVCVVHKVLMVLLRVEGILVSWRVFEQIFHLLLHPGTVYFAKVKRLVILVQLLRSTSMLLLYN